LKIFSMLSCAAGKRLRVPSPDLTKEIITVPMPLADLAAAHDTIK
jgi:hypothetical protein